MELIPVLSTIILVATITTFILAIGAYILYKRREKRGEQYTSFRPAAPLTAEYITPGLDEINGQVREKGKVYEQTFSEKVTLSERSAKGPRVRTIKESLKQTVQKSAPEKFLKYTSEGYISAKEDENKGGTLRWK